MSFQTALSRVAMALLVAASAVSVACGKDGGSEPPPLPDAWDVQVVPNDLVSIDAIGGTATLRAIPRDANGRPIDAAPVTWTTSGGGVALDSTILQKTGNATHTMTVTAQRTGDFLVSAISGGASSQFMIRVAQLPTGFALVSGDHQRGIAHRALSRPVELRVVDRLGAALSSLDSRYIVQFAVDGGGAATVGSPTSGIVRVAWTLGSADTITQHLSVALYDQFGGRVVVPSFGLTATVITSGPAELRALSSTNQLGYLRADVAPPAIQVLDPNGSPLSGVPVTFAMTAGNGSIGGTHVVTDSSGLATASQWVVGISPGLNEVTASVDGLDPIVFQTAGCSDYGESTRIRLCFRSPTSDDQAVAFAAAATRWSGILAEDLPDFEGDIPEGVCGGLPAIPGGIHNVIIFVSITPIDGVNGVLAQGGPCAVRSASYLPLIGRIYLDAADVAPLVAKGNLASTATHEMGHVLGIGTLWQAKNVLVNPSTASASVDTYFSGPLAVAAFDAAGGAVYPGAKVPVENSGGEGTMNSHWRESVLRSELMTGYLNPESNPLSAVTIQSLADIGYVVRVSAADPWSLSAAARVSPFAAAEGVVLTADALPLPLVAIDRAGRMTRVPRGRR